MIKYLLISFASILLFTQNLLYAQTSEEKYKQAEDFIEDENFHKALSIYQELLREFPNNANLNFKIGYAYLNTATEKVKAIPYLEFASKHISKDYKINTFNEVNSPIETLFYLGKAYHVNYRFDDAESTLIDLKGQIGTEDKEFIQKINHELASCQIARMQIKSPIEMSVTNLGKTINSTYTEHSPVISGDESLLIFTSKREGNTGGKTTDDGQSFEDIYISSFDGKKYTQAQKISDNINTDGHEASIGLSFDGSKLFIYKDDNNDGNIYVSNRQGAQWMVAEKLPEPINSKWRETHGSISLDQNEIFFTSDRKGGYGGLDIYRVRRLPNGSWSNALNLGPIINTPYDEEGPYLHPDGTSLFFSSEGHATMGGFDIFVSTVDEDGVWSQPKNIGYPINTPDDDIYYVPSVDGRRAYYASFGNNSIGNYDIFRIDLAETHIRNQTVIVGYAMSATGIMLENGVITITDDDDKLVGIYTPDPNSKKFLFILPRGKTFTALFESSNVPPFTYTVNVPNYAYDQTRQVVIFNDIIVRSEKDQLATKELNAQHEMANNANPDAQKDNLGLNKETIEAKSAVGENTSSSEISTKELLTSSELYKNDTYMESSALKQNQEEAEITTNVDSLAKAANDADIHAKNKKYKRKGEGLFANLSSREVKIFGFSGLIALLLGVIIIFIVKRRR